MIAMRAASRLYLARIADDFYLGLVLINRFQQGHDFFVYAARQLVKFPSTQLVPCEGVAHDLFTHTNAVRHFEAGRGAMLWRTRTQARSASPRPIRRGKA